MTKQIFQKITTTTSVSILETWGKGVPIAHQINEPTTK